MNELNQHHNNIPSLAPKFESIESSWGNLDFDRNSKLTASRLQPTLESPLSKFRLKTPVILRDEAICAALDLAKLPTDAYAKLATCVQQVGGAMLATVDDLASVPLRDIPIRIAPVYSYGMPTSDALLSADAIELQLGDWSQASRRSQSPASLRSLRIDWPVDTPDLLRLAKKIELIRFLAQSSVPVGVAIPIGDASEAGLANLQWLCEIGIDFVTVRSSAACLGDQHPAREYFPCDPIELTRLMRKLLDPLAEKQVAIVIDHPWIDGFQAAQAILSGATYIGVGSYLATAFLTAAEATKSSSIDSLTSELLGRSSAQTNSTSSFLGSNTLQKVDLNSPMSLFLDQLQSSLQYAL